MNKFILAVVIMGVALAFSFNRVDANPGNAKYEYAILKWDGPDRLFYNLPNDFKMVHMKDGGVSIPKDAQPEEFCLAYGVNQMTKEGWEPVDFDSRRVLMRRSK